LKITINHLYKSKYVSLILLGVVTFFSLVRFIHINADFPSHITTSGALYTDEGWYAGSAIRHYLTGNWYLAGDINTAVTQPGGQLLYRLSFAIFGLSLTSARIVIIVTFILLILCMALWIRRYYGNVAAIICGLILTTNYYAFAYSRLALRFLIALFFIILSFWMADIIKSNRKALKLVIASLLLTYGILTYTTSIIAVPLLLFIIWKNGKNSREKFLRLTTLSVIIAAVYSGYFLIMKHYFPIDVANDTNIVGNNLITHLAEWLRNFAEVIYLIFNNLGPDLVGLVVMLILVSFVISKHFRSSTIVHIFILFTLLNIAVLSINTYSPPRYYLMFLAPISGLCAISFTTFIGWLKEQHRGKLVILPTLLIFLVCFRGSWNIINYLAKPQYTFYQMTQGVKDIIQEREGSTNGITLFGDIADSVSLETGTDAINNGVWTLKNEAARLAQYHPKYLIVHTSDVVQVATSEGATITELGSWDVYNNYYANGEPVRLYLANWP
jgi:4-amino-4-deoxy-L-arabinose transferase-like glycosyltransferase